VTPQAPSPHDGTIEASITDANESAWHDHARSLITDLFQRSEAVYWVDLILSASTGWGMTFVYFTSPAWSATQLTAFLIASVMFFRVGTFIHEIVHMPSGQMTAFKRVWNLLVGVPLLMPWVIYRNHIEHHNHRQFGTPADGEYLPLASSPIAETLKYLLRAPLLPLFMLVRFGVLGPLSWLHPRLREWVLIRVSAAVSNPHYRKRFPKRDETHLQIVEALCFAYLLAIAVLIGVGSVSFGEFCMGYALLGSALALNWIRNLAAHRYGNDGTRMTLSEQVAESINITGQTWLTIALFPIGLRYHALHHMFPALPYHRLGQAHRRLMQGLPENSPYRLSNRHSFFAAVAELWQSASRTPEERSSMRAWTPDSGRS
jgi:fatty acid desaturase